MHQNSYLNFALLLRDPKSGFQNANPDFPIEWILKDDRAHNWKSGLKEIKFTTSKGINLLDGYFNTGLAVVYSRKRL